MQTLIERAADACQVLAEAVQAETDRSSMADFRSDISTITHLDLPETVTDLFCEHANEIIGAGLEVWAYSLEADPLPWCEEVLTSTLHQYLIESYPDIMSQPREFELDLPEFQLGVSSFWAALTQDSSTSSGLNHAVLLRCLEKTVQDCKAVIDTYHKHIPKLTNTSIVASGTRSGLASVCALIRRNLPDSAQMVSNLQLTRLALSEDLGLADKAKEAFSAVCLLAISVASGREATVKDLMAGKLVSRNTGEGVAVEDLLDMEVYSRAFVVPLAEIMAYKE